MKEGSHRWSIEFRQGIVLKLLSKIENESNPSQRKTDILKLILVRKGFTAKGEW